MQQVLEVNEGFQPRPSSDGDGDNLVVAITGWRDAVTIAGGGNLRKEAGEQPHDESDGKVDDAAS